MRVLVVEDEKRLCDMVAGHLKRSGYEVDVCYEGDSASELVLSEEYDLVVLDLNLPGTGGMDILRSIRSADDRTKVLILSARNEVTEKVAGFDAGANDYLVKPFHLDELEARARSLTRRKFVQQSVTLTCGEMSFDTKKRLASIRGVPVSLTRKEAGVLEYLLLNQGRPVSQEELIEHVWDAYADPFSNSVRVHICSLRKKLKVVSGRDFIVNRLGEGYLVRDGAE